MKTQFAQPRACETIPCGGVGHLQTADRIDKENSINSGIIINSISRIK